MTDWIKILKAICPGGKSYVLKGTAAAMPECIRIANLNTPLRLAHFLAQIAHESDGFKTTVEYASGAAYEGRDDLGNTHPGDGVRFKGRGDIQTTGRENYEIVSKELGVDFVKNPEKLAEFPWAALSSAMFWKRKKINALADLDNCTLVTKRVNGGKRGLAQRMAYLKTAKRVLAAEIQRVANVPEAPPAVTAETARAAGSRTIGGVDTAQVGLAGSVVAGGAAVTDVVSQGANMVSQISTAHEQISSSRQLFSWAADHWEIFATAGFAVVAIVCLYFTWRGLQQVKHAYLDDQHRKLLADVSEANDAAFVEQLLSDDDDPPEQIDENETDDPPEPATEETPEDEIHNQGGA